MTERNLALVGTGYWGKNLVRNFHQLCLPSKFYLKSNTMCDTFGNVS
jgi:hypothetical protein